MLWICFVIHPQGSSTLVFSTGRLRCCVSDDCKLYSFTTGSKTETTAAHKVLLRDDWVVVFIHLYSRPLWYCDVQRSRNSAIDQLTFYDTHPAVASVAQASFGKSFTKQWWSFSGSDIIGALINHTEVWFSHLFGGLQRPLLFCFFSSSC